MSTYVELGVGSGIFQKSTGSVPRGPKLILKVRGGPSLTLDFFLAIVSLLVG